MAELSLQPELYFLKHKETSPLKELSWELPFNSKELFSGVDVLSGFELLDFKEFPHGRGQHFAPLLILECFLFLREGPTWYAWLDLNLTILLPLPLEHWDYNTKLQIFPLLSIWLQNS